MRRNKKEEQHIVEFGLPHIPKNVRESFDNVFYHKWQVQNEIIDLIERRITKLCAEDESFKKAMEYLKEESEKNDNIAINEKERDDTLKEAFDIVRDCFIKYKILYDVGKEYRKIIDKKHKIYLHDDILEYAMSEKIKAYETTFIYKKGYKVSKKQLKNVHSVRSKAQIPNSSCAMKIVKEEDKFFLVMQDFSNKVAWSYLAKYYDNKTKQYKQGVTKFNKSKKVKVEIYYNPDDLLQKQVLDESYKHGSIMLIRKKKHGKYMYTVQACLEGKSPIIYEIPSDSYKNTISANVGTEICAVVNKETGEQCIYSLYKNSKKVCDEIANINRYMDNSKRVMNPDLYKEDGQIKYKKEEMKELGLKWNFSKRYKIARRRLNELYRKMKDSRKTLNYTLAKEIFMNNEIKNLYVDHNQIKGWKVKKCRAAKKTLDRLNKTPRSAKGYAKKVQERAPAQFTERLKYLTSKTNGKIIEMKTFNSSCYNPFTGKNDIFESLSDRFTRIDLEVRDYEYNPEAVDLFKTINTVKDKEGNVYYLQRDLFAAEKMLFINKVTKTAKNKKGEEFDVEEDEFDYDKFIVHFKNKFYPKHIEYMKKLLKDRYNKEQLSGTVFGD